MMSNRFCSNKKRKDVPVIVITGYDYSLEQGLDLVAEGKLVTSSGGCVFSCCVCGKSVGGSQDYVYYFIGSDLYCEYHWKLKKRESEEANT